MGRKGGRDMTIKTKYNIGQEVWTLDFFKEPNKGEIWSVTTLNTSTKERDYISYYIHHIGNRMEYEIFPTKEELLNSLRDDKIRYRLNR